MAENGGGDVSLETNLARPKELIRADLELSRKKLEQLQEETGVWMGELDALPEGKRDLVFEWGGKVEKGEITLEEAREQSPTEIHENLDKFNGFLSRGKEIEFEENKLKSEYLPHIKQEYEDRLKQISPLIGYDKVFDYYHEINNYTKQGKDNADHIANTATELFTLRRFQHELLFENLDADYDQYNYRLGVLVQFEDTWREKGFLLQDPDPNFDMKGNFSEDSKAIRGQIAKQAEEALKTLERYGELFKTYRPSIINSREDVDYDLDQTHRIMDRGGNYLYDAKKFDEIDFDPNFVKAAQKHVRQLIINHELAGRLSRSQETLKQERQRIDSIDSESLLAGIEHKNFNVPDGEEVAMDIKEAMNEIKEIMPPDFIKRLRSVSYKPEAEKTGEEDVNTETVGRFFPIFGEGDNWDKIQATEIEVYKPFFISPEAKLELKLYIKKEFIETLHHEFGHNAHYSLDLDEMEAWEKVMSTDKTPITWYVKYAREKETGTGKREDFSESFMMFLNNPAVLAIVSPIRFQFMLEYFGRHLQTEQGKGFSEKLMKDMLLSRIVWKQQGYADEDIRRIYLGHTE